MIYSKLLAITTSTESMSVSSITNVDRNPSAIGQCASYTIRNDCEPSHKDTCTHDADCPYLQKCCNTGCVKTCVYPYRTTGGYTTFLLLSYIGISIVINGCFSVLIPNRKLEALIAVLCWIVFYLLTYLSSPFSVEISFESIQYFSVFFLAQTIVNDSLQFFVNGLFWISGCLHLKVALQKISSRVSARCKEGIKLIPYIKCRFKKMLQRHLEFQHFF